MQAKSLESIIKNYISLQTLWEEAVNTSHDTESLQTLWEEAVNTSHDTEIIARMRGVAAQMSKFEFFLDLSYVSCY